MKRNIIEIDRDKCNGCRLCVEACHEGALVMQDGKATLVSESYCDGLGDCLPECPTGAIRITKKEAKPFIAPAPGSKADLAAKQQGCPPSGCPGSQSRSVQPAGDVLDAQPIATKKASELRQWPVQIKLAPLQAPFYENAHLLIAADCAAYAHANFHQDFMRGKVTLIGCPKLDAVDYSEKLSKILAANPIRRLSLVRMQVPCCGGLEMAVQKALQASEKMIPWQVVTLTTEGKVLED